MVQPVMLNWLRKASCWSYASALQDNDGPLVWRLSASSAVTPAGTQCQAGMHSRCTAYNSSCKRQLPNQRYT